MQNDLGTQNNKTNVWQMIVFDVREMKKQEGGDICVRLIYYADKDAFKIILPFLGVV